MNLLTLILAAISSSGELFTWGCGEYGRLGHGDNASQWRPKQVKALADHRVVQVACGSRDAQTLALTDEGMVFSWGDGDFGKLGRGGSDGCAYPQVWIFIGVVCKTNAFFSVPTLAHLNSGNKRARANLFQNISMAMIRGNIINVKSTLPPLDKKQEFLFLN